MRRLLAHLESRHVSRVVYGAIIGLAVIVALDAHPPEAHVVLATLVGTAIAVALAEVYSQFLGLRTQLHHGPDPAQRHEIYADTGAVAFGVAFPAIFFVLAAAGAIELDTAFDAAVWSGLGLIAFYGFCAARLSGRPLLTSLLHGFGAGLIGALLIVLKVVFH